ncbi:YdeI/OmpD-associated family protein [Sinomicrobium oceani]|uniref:YdeI/OmpD-associated family protein n=1 Tax=Sinomicrobium oceani TaxID=1150368 RepID=UPI00227A8538|nr:YdeI/OmpD-associated family protein [Sinomicrobium oceani]
MESFSAPIVKIDSPVWTFVIRVPDAVAEKLIPKTTDKRVICTFNSKISKPCALMPSGEGSYHILINKKELRELGTDIGETLRVALKPDTSAYGIPMDEEFRAVLDSDPEGERLFEALTPGKKRTLLYMVGKLKSTPLKIQRAVTIIDHLKTTGGQVDYKLLNREIREQKR